MTIEIILAEFGSSRFNNGDAALPTDRLEPSLSSFRKHFPEAQFTVYTDQDWPCSAGVRVVTVDPPFDRRHERYGNRANDWAQAWGLLQSKAEVAIAVDSDLLCVSDRVRDIIPIAKRFGLCMPVNGRHLLWRDARSQCDGGKVQDESRGSGMCHCTAFWAIGSRLHRALLQEYCEQIVYDAEHGCGARGPLSLGRAQWKVGASPYTLPSHWCVTGSNLWIEPEHAIILHVGHKAVSDRYRELIASQG